ncbi:zf-HC2 domain-containing protein [Phytohabitans sp. ZYX-F-186]|uniref:Zf-HC2 domain-containing protein n=1 Tax=Phytohabitans maris TaxID=3071409 RepID=A0ABU0ZMW8_9ACTN|nr:zf-HC2 domain-containing protein [Phytohabitans sp. ZYX-F-186]MDQ7908388.1 zf-HC2 domain-containing protein [Phytohabitans sp. ZYX-F-186]
MRCDYAYDSGAYVLGALSPSERAAYERHLAECPTCREAVGEVAVLPGLLGRLDPAGLEQIASAPSAESRMPDLLSAVTEVRRKERSARRWRTAGSLLTAACLALFAGFGAGILRDGSSAGTQPPPVAQATTPGPVKPRMVAMKSVVGELPITAEVGLTPTKWGTRVTVHCAYPAQGGQSKTYTYRLMAWDSEGEKEEIGSWSVSPGADEVFPAVTSFSPDQLARLALTKKDGTPLMEYKVP